VLTVLCQTLCNHQTIAYTFLRNKMASLVDTRHDSFRHEADPNFSGSSNDEEVESSDEEVLLACVYENLSFLLLLRSAVNVKARAKEKGSAQELALQRKLSMWL